MHFRGGERRPGWSGYTAFVLSGGGARGAVQVGMLRALLEAGERPDVIVGTSIGAWNGAWLARHPNLEGLNELEDLWHGLTSSKVLLGRETYGAPPARAIAGMLVLSAARRVAQGAPSLYSDAGMSQLVERLIGNWTFEDLTLPMRVIAANLSHGGRAVFYSGPLAPPVLASSAIPGIFPPVRIGEQVYVDGGALENASLDVAYDLGARRLFVLDVGYDSNTDENALWAAVSQHHVEHARQSTTHALAAVLERTAQVMSRYHLEQALRRLPPGIEVHVLSGTTAGGLLDFGRSAELMQQGYARTQAHLGALSPSTTNVAEHDSNGERALASTALTDRASMAASA
ncbi:MAG TPA: patatin-like phospholipase family protein [Ktedonobacterales bacterium]|jgi:predicted acylesterase/phospholipase RssA|nr:patatin-like phospholipase family protein [Ktedonobacterales bacterium]